MNNGLLSKLFREIDMTVFFQKISKWLMAGLCLFVLVGCQAPGHPDNTDIFNLTLWQGVNPPANRDVLQELVAKFNQAHPQIKVKSLYVGQQEQQTPKILASVVGNAPPDLLWFNPTITGQLVELGAIRPLDDLLATSPLRQELDPALLESMQFQGYTWSIPFGTNNVGVFYRPSLLEKAGITDLPRTWQELQQVAKALTSDTNGDGRIDQHGILLPLGKGEWTVFMWLPFMWSDGGQLTDSSSDLTKVNLLNPGAIAALQFWNDLVKDGSASLSLPERGFELDNFLSGKVAMQLSGPWTLRELQTTGVDFGVFPLPKQVQQTTIIGGENLFLFKTTPEREKAAFTFAEYVMGEEFQTKWALGTGYLPVNTKVRQSQAYQEFVRQQPALKVFLAQTEYGRTRPLLLGYRRISESLGRAIESVLLGKNSPRQALKNAQQRLEFKF